MVRPPSYLIPHPVLGEDAVRRAYLAQKLQKLGVMIPTGPTMFADIVRKMLLKRPEKPKKPKKPEEPKKPAQYAEVDVPGHTYVSKEEFEAAGREAQIDEASDGHASGYNSLTDTGTIVDRDGNSTPITGLRQVYNPGRHAATLGDKGIDARLRTGAVTGDNPQEDAPSTSSRFLSYSVQNEAHHAALDAFHRTLGDGTLPKTEDERFHNAYHIVTDMGKPVGKSFHGVGTKEEKWVNSVFGPRKAKVYSQTTGPVFTQHVRTVFNIDSNGRVTRGQHFPTSPGDALKGHQGKVKTGSSTVFAKTHDSHVAPKAHPDNLTFAWDKPK